MADFQLKVTAETQRAEKDLQRLGITANNATKDRKLRIDVSELNRNFKDVQSNVKEASNTIQTFYRISKNVPGIGDRVREFENLAKGTADLAKNAPASAAALRENAKAGSILANSFEAAGTGAGRLVNNLAKAGFALFAVKEAVGVVRSAFSGFFNETIGREVKLRETILKTQTTLASTNKVFRNGSEITDPFEKIVALTGEVNKRIDSIRERSIALAGVTSNDVIEVFGIVASQVGQIGGGLKDAEDLAINFAAALGTFNIPLYQARQEIGSILRGDITMDSYLAKALGITNEDIAKAKSQTGGVIKFLEERLSAAVAGQRIAAQGFAGVVSNIRDLSELVSQRFGAGLLDPLLGGLSKVFDFLFKIREEVFAIASGMGRGLGQLLSTNLNIIGGGSALFGQIGAGAEGFAAQLAEGVKRAFASLQSDANSFIAPVRNLLEEVTKSIGLLVEGLARLAQGFISIKIENFKALVQILSNLSEAVTVFAAGLGQVLRAYGQLLQVPFVQYLSQISTQFQLLERLGVMSAVKLGFAAAGLIAAWQPIVTFFQALAARIAALIGGMVAAVGAAVARMGALIAAFAGTITATAPAVEALKTQLMGLSTAFTTSGASAEKAGVSIARFGGATTAAVKTVSNAVFGFIKFNLILLAVQLAITALIDIFGRFQQQQEESSRSQKAAQALKDLQTKYKDVGEAATSAEKSAKDFAESLVNAQYGRNLDALEKVREKINQIRYELKPGIQSWGEFWSAVSGSEVGRFEARSRQVLQGLIAQERDLKNKLGAVDALRDRQRAEENIRLEADKRINLEKEIGDIRKQQQDQLFQVQQQRAQKEVEIFRAAGELRIFQIEQANKKLIEGEEGASRSALEALNNYISTRERGELDIESAKKSLAIEATNLEKQISDYRLENEKKIAEIRKRAGDYEKNVADFRRQAAGQSTPIGGATGLVQGNTGTSSSGPHFHVSGASSEAEARAIFAPAINRQLQLTDTPGSPRSGGRRHAGYDLAGPAGTPLNLAQGYSLTNFTRDPRGLGGNYATIAGPNNKSYKVMHLQDPGSGYKGPGSSSAAPQAPSFADVNAPAVAKYAASVRSLTSAMARLQAIQSDLSGAKTKAAFDEVAKAAFQPVGFESYQDKLYELDGVMQSLAQGTYDAFSPERSQIAAEQAAKLLSSQRELAQVIVGINSRANLSEREKAAAIAAVTAVHATFVRSLRDEEQIRQRLSAIQQGVDLARQFAQETAQIARENEIIRERNRLMALGASPEQIERALEKLRIDQQYKAVNEQLNQSLRTQLALRDQLQQKIAAANPKDKAELQRQLDAALAEIQRLQKLIAQLQAELDKRKGAADSKPSEKPKDPKSIIGGKIGTLQEELKDLANWGNIVVRTADTIESAFGAAFRDVITGAASVQEALGNTFKKIGDMFIEMATQMIAKMLVMYALKALLSLFSGGGTFGTGQSGSEGSAVVQAANGASFAKGIAQFGAGGSFANSIVSTPTLFRFADGGAPRLGVMGEAGPEAIMPLARGSDGKLGVQVSGTRNAMNRYAPSAYGSTALVDTEQASNRISTPLMGGPIDVRYTVERINTVDYVTADQFQRGMQQAASQGAAQGERLALATLRQNTAQRKRIGL